MLVFAQVGVHVRTYMCTLVTACPHENITDKQQDTLIRQFVRYTKTNVPQYAVNM